MAPLIDAYYRWVEIRAFPVRESRSTRRRDQRLQPLLRRGKCTVVEFVYSECCLVPVDLVPRRDHPGLAVGNARLPIRSQLGQDGNEAQYRRRNSNSYDGVKVLLIRAERPRYRRQHLSAMLAFDS